MTAPLILTRDQSLLEEVLRLAAAAGVTPEAVDVGAALQRWSTAPVLLIGVDVADELAALGPPRRRDAWVVAWGGVPDGVFRTAVALGVEGVVELQRSASWLVEVLTDLGDRADRASDGLVVGVTGGCGGAGATTLACALAQEAARRGRAVVVDADPLGPGADRILGLDDVEGARWDALCATTGRLSSRALREALPRRQGLGVLAWRPGEPASLQAFAVREVLSAARRGHDLVVVDLPRRTDPLVEEVVARCDRLLVVVLPTVAGVAAAVRTCAHFRDPTRVRLVVRGTGVDPRAIARATGVPVLLQMSEQRGLAEAVDLGLGPVRSSRGALGRAVGEVLDQLSMMRPAAA